MNFISIYFMILIIVFFVFLFTGKSKSDFWNSIHAACYAIMIFGALMLLPILVIAMITK